MDTKASELDDRVEQIRRRLLTVQDFVAELASLGELDIAENLAEVDLAEVARAVMKTLEARAARGGVTLKLVLAREREGASRDSSRHLAREASREEAREHDASEPPSVRAVVRGAPRALSMLVRALLDQAIAATPKGREVTLTISANDVAPSSAATRARGGDRHGLGARLIVDDGGTSLPASARRALVALDVEPGTYGRPSAIPLYVASEIVAHHGGMLDLGDSPPNESGGTGVRVVVTFPR